MAVRKAQPRKPEQSAVDLAIAAIEGRPNPLDDPEMAKVSPDRTSLDLPDERGRPVGEVRRRNSAIAQQQSVGSHGRIRRGQEGKP